MVDVQIPELVAAAAAGDHKGWNELVRRFGGLVWTVARGYRLSTEDIEDVSQIVWLLVAGHIGQLRDPEAVAGVDSDHHPP
jgi:DNA-directed RNA polymerase specialized sigma24 family protein